MSRVQYAAVEPNWVHVTLGQSVVMTVREGPEIPVHEAALGDTRASRLDLGEIFQAHAAYVGRLALRLLGRSEDMEDVVQDVFLEAMPRLGEIRDPQAMRSWLAVITARTVSHRLRRLRVRRWLGLSAMPVDVPEIAVAATAEQRVVLRELYQLLDSLPARQRIAWILRTMEHLKLEEVAEACNCSVSAVKRRVTAVQEQIDKVIGRE